MIVSAEELRKLDALGLKEYAGDTAALHGEERKTYDALMKTPVDVRLIAEEGVCHDSLYRICRDAEGIYISFGALRRHVDSQLTAERRYYMLNWRMLSVLFGGIYVGDPEDLLNHRAGIERGILYPTRGLGKKVSHVRFLAG